MNPQVHSSPGGAFEASLVSSRSVSAAAAGGAVCVNCSEARAKRDGGTSSCPSHARPHLHFSLHLLGEREPQLGRFVLITFHEERAGGRGGGGKLSSEGAGLLASPANDMQEQVEGGVSLRGGG